MLYRAIGNDTGSWEGLVHHMLSAACCPPPLDFNGVSVKQVGLGGKIESIGITHCVLLYFTLGIAECPWRMVDFTSEDLAFFVSAVKTVSCCQPVFECVWLCVKWIPNWFIAADEVC